MNYRIDLKHQIKSIKDGLILIIICILGIAVLYFIGAISYNDFPDILIVIGLWNLLFFLPAFYLHVQYLLENFNTEVSINEHNKTITIKTRSIGKTYNLSEVLAVEQHLAITQKNRIDNRGRYKMPWSRYGYIKLKLSDGNSIFITSLMMDVIDPPLTVNNTYYRFFQYIDKQEVLISDKRKMIVREKEEKLNSYKEKFQGLSLEELQIKVYNSEKYEPEAVYAAKEILIEKFGLKK